MELSISNKMKKEFNQMNMLMFLKGLKNFILIEKVFGYLKLMIIRLEKELEIFRITIKECLGNTEDKQLLVAGWLSCGN